jgi:hypothetical protein
VLLSFEGLVTGVALGGLPVRAAFALRCAAGTFHGAGRIRGSDGEGERQRPSLLLCPTTKPFHRETLWPELTQS